MATISEQELRLFVESVKNYFTVTTRQEPQVTSAYLGTESMQGHEFNGVVSFSGQYNGHVIVSMPARMLRELLLLQHETDMRDDNLLDAVGEVANTLGGNARKQLGAGLEISVPVTFQGQMGSEAGVRSRVRKRPFLISLRWNHHSALVCVDLERTH
ncbi:MAG: chemotaxis protein CheX [Brachymonas sp.]|nr:chemotaxis protein CheX [Brachymonas sp.]